MNEPIAHVTTAPESKLTGLCDVALQDALVTFDDNGERLHLYDDERFVKSLAGNGYRIVPAAFAAGHTAWRGTHRHFKTGTLYRVTGERLNVEHDESVVCVDYDNEQGAKFSQSKERFFGLVDVPGPEMQVRFISLVPEQEGSGLSSPEDAQQPTPTHDEARETARKILDSGEALSATNAEIRELARAYLEPSSSDLVKALEKETDVWRDLVERAHHLALCVFKGSTKADYERARHNAAVLANAIDHARQNEWNRSALRSHRVEK